jgi:hypothetical protein
MVGNTEKASENPSIFGSKLFKNRQFITSSPTTTLSSHLEDTGYKPPHYLFASLLALLPSMISFSLGS